MVTEILRKTDLTGVALAIKPAEEIAKLTRSLVENGDLTESESEELISIHKKLSSYLISSSNEETSK